MPFGRANATEERVIWNRIVQLRLGTGKDLGYVCVVVDSNRPPKATVSRMTPKGAKNPICNPYLEVPMAVTRRRVASGGRFWIIPGHTVMVFASPTPCQVVSRRPRGLSTRPMFFAPAFDNAEAMSFGFKVHLWP